MVVYVIMGMYVNAKLIKPSCMHKLNGCFLLLILLPLKAPYVVKYYSKISVLRPTYRPVMDQTFRGGFGS